MLLSVARTEFKARTVLKARMVGNSFRQSGGFGVQFIRGAGHLLQQLVRLMRQLLLAAAGLFELVMRPEPHRRGLPTSDPLAHRVHLGHHLAAQADIGIGGAAVGNVRSVHQPVLQFEGIFRPTPGAALTHDNVTSNIGARAFP